MARKHSDVNIQGGKHTESMVSEFRIRRCYQENKVVSLFKKIL